MRQTPRITPSAQTQLGRYEIRSLIGAGGMGEVYRAHDSQLARDVSIKILLASFSADRERLARFEQEARAAGLLNHPNILAIYDTGTHDDTPYIVSELLEGETLYERLCRVVALPVRKAIVYARKTVRVFGERGGALSKRRPHRRR